MQQQFRNIKASSFDPLKIYLVNYLTDVKYNNSDTVGQHTRPDNKKKQRIRFLWIEAKTLPRFYPN